MLVLGAVYSLVRGGGSARLLVILLFDVICSMIYVFVPFTLSYVHYFPLFLGYSNLVLTGKNVCWVNELQ